MGRYALGYITVKLMSQKGIVAVAYESGQEEVCYGVCEEQSRRVIKIRKITVLAGRALFLAFGK